jgi:hypothetical protein
MRHSLAAPPAFSLQTRGHENKRDALHHLLENFQGPRAAPVGTGILGHDQVKLLLAQLLDTLPQGQNDIGLDGKLRPLQLLHARIDFVSVTVDK